MGWLDANEYLLMELAVRERTADAGEIDGAPVSDADETTEPEPREPVERGVLIRAPRIPRCPGAVARWT